jgi:hypothetical protein
MIDVNKQSYSFLYASALALLHKKFPTEPYSLFSYCTEFKSTDLAPLMTYLDTKLGSAIAQTVSCSLPNAAARVRTRVRLCGISGGQWHWGRFSPSTAVSLATHPIDCSTLIIIHHPGLVQ